MKQEKEEWQNPIDKDKITENPHNLPYAHNVGSAIIFPEDKDRIKSNAMSAMVEQTNVQMKQIYEQMELLVQQANQLKARVEISEEIYASEMAFKPITGHTYHLYEDDKGKKILSMIGPGEWARGMKYKKFIATAKLSGDHTWDIIKKADS
ncbi:MAG: DUF2452 domain-containing protein [Bacteroidetes bacterium]|nr:MAG: DUF2452 domain-containing protein [Bacteroidota bacterium]MBL1145195.1 DUF2452 domain-containing protein [Bacteroidota bacterium]NOG57991.1 DUF2452 domain-containing protein [Bacteroidota bacterium]